jgi:2-iminobutanoate/2-iminopropanoate deaminase
MTPILSQTVQVPGAPRAIGPYSQAKVVSLGQGVGHLVFTAGQLGLDPQTGELVSGGVGEQTDRALRNLAAVLAGASLTLVHVVKTTVYLVDMADFEAMNQVYARHFPESPPARTTIAAAGLPRGARVEIEVVAAGPAT